MGTKFVGATPSNAADLATKGYVDQYDGFIVPSDYGANAWTFDPALGSANVAPSAGRIQSIRFRAQLGGAVTSVWMSCQTLQTTPTAIHVGIYDLSGNRLGWNSSSAHVAFQTTGQKNITISSVTLVAGTPYMFTFLSVGGTSPTIVSTIGTGVPTLSQTAGASTPLRQAQSGTGQTTLSSTLDWTTFSAVGNGPLALFKA